MSAGRSILVAVCVVLATSIGRVPASPLQLTDLLSLVRFPIESGPRVVISPDGSWVAYILEIPFGGNNSGTDIAHEGRKQLWVRNLASGVPIQIGMSAMDVANPTWSPDGKRLAFCSGSGTNGKVAIWERSNGKIHVVPLVLTQFAPSIQWTLDSTRILISRALYPAIPQIAMHPPSATATPAITVLMNNPSQSRGSNGNFIRRVAPDTKTAVDLVFVNVKTSTIAPVIKNITPRFYQLSPDGTRLFYTINTGIVNGDINYREIFDVNVVDLRTRSVMRVAHDILTNLFSYMVWSPDGSKIAFIGGNLEDDVGAPLGNQNDVFPGSCYIIDVRHPGALRRIGTRLFSRIDPLLWSDDGSRIYAFMGDSVGIGAISLSTGLSTPLILLQNAAFKPAFVKAGNRVYIIANTDKGETQVRNLELRSGRSMMVFHGFQSIDDLTVSRDGTHAAYIGEDVSHPSDVWITGANFGYRYRLTHFNPLIEHRTLSNQQETVSWYSRSGAPFDGVLLLPANYQSNKRYPTILYVYAGGRTGSESRNGFGMSGDQRAGSYFNLQLFASRGYAVFVPNSTLRVGHPMRDIADVILPGVDKIVAMGIANPARLGVYGQSYGGYSTLSLIVQTNSFKAAVATSGISDLITNYGYLHSDSSDWTGWAESEQGGMGGTPWQYRNRYIENSPFFYLDRVQTPILLEYGDIDEAVAPFNSQMAFVALRRLGKTAMLLGYAGEGHILEKTSNQIDFTNRLLNWFQKYLKTSPMR